MKAKVIKINQEGLEFDNGLKLYSYHETDCCESHYLSTSDLDLYDFDGLEFDFMNPNTINKIKDYGIELIPIKGFPVRIPAYGYNNGYYSTDLSVIVEDGKDFKLIIDISECQDIT